MKASGANNPFPVRQEELPPIKSATGVDTWVEDVYGEGAWVPSDAPVGAEFIGLAAKRRRVVLFFAFLSVLIALLWGRTAYLVANGGAYSERSLSNRTRIIVSSPARGVVYDRNGIRLVENVPDLSLAVVPSDLPADETEKQKAIAAIAALAGVDPAAAAAEVVNYGSKGYQPVIIAEQITRDQAVDLSIAEAEYPAIRIIHGSHRYYGLSNTTQSLSHVLGYMGRVQREDLDKEELNYQPADFLGRTGLENYYEQTLRGSIGIKRMEVDALGNEVRVVDEITAKPGNSLQLSIDSGLQTAAEESLGRILRKNGLKRGAVVVENVTNGEILSLVSLPAYSDNRFSSGISNDEYRSLADDPNQPLFGRAIAGGYPSGSTVKLIVAAAALKEGVITPKTTVNSTGGIMYADRWWFPDWKAGGHGLTDVRKAISWSVNTFFYMIGGGYESFKGLGVDRLLEYFAQFGLGKPLGIDLPHESGGFCRRRSGKYRKAAATGSSAIPITYPSARATWWSLLCRSRHGPRLSPTAAPCGSRAWFPLFLTPTAPSRRSSGRLPCGPISFPTPIFSRFAPACATRCFGAAPPASAIPASRSPARPALPSGTRKKPIMPGSPASLPTIIRRSP